MRAVGWEHPRCSVPMLAAAERWERGGQCPVVWSFRPLQDFNDQPLDELVDAFDLLVIDHPFVGTAAASGLLRPVDELLGPAFVAELMEDSAGPSQASYHRDGQTWAIALDAACHTTAWRPDLLGAAGIEVPRTWTEVGRLAAAFPGRVGWPLAPTDAACSLLTLLAGAGQAWTDGTMPSRASVHEAIAFITAVLPDLHPASLDANPPAMLDLMASGDQLLHVPLTFGYSTYARRASPGAVAFGDVPTWRGQPTSPLLGGAGLAVSARSSLRPGVTEFVAWLASRAVQRDVVARADGQPGRRSAWVDPATDAASGGFFGATLDALERSHVRPRAMWWPALQDTVGQVLNTGLRAGLAPGALTDAVGRSLLDATGLAFPNSAR